MIKGCSIRKAVISDAEKIHQLAIESLDVSEVDSIDDLAWYIKNEYGLVACHDEKIVGYLLMSQGSDTTGITGSVYGKYHYIYWLVVNLKFRRLGIGQGLIDQALACCKKKYHVDNIYLYVRSKNVKAQALYNKVGFKTVRTIENFYSKCTSSEIDHCYFMKKSISPPITTSSTSTTSLSSSSSSSLEEEEKKTTTF